MSRGPSMTNTNTSAVDSVGKASSFSSKGTKEPINTFFKNSDKQTSVPICALTKESMAYLEERLETGLDDEAEFLDEFMETCKRTEKAYIIARQYHNDPEHPTTLTPLALGPPSAQLQKLERIVSARSPDTILWIDMMGTEEIALKGISSLCQLPPDTITESIRRSSRRLHRTSIEFHPDYAYLQLLIQQSSAQANPTVSELVDPFAEMVKNAWQPKPDTGKGQSEVRERRRKAKEEKWAQWVKGNDYSGAVRVGFLSVFMVPALNIVVTVSHPYYNDPATRLVIDTGKTEYLEHGQLGIIQDPTVFGAAMVHRVVGYASGCTRQIDQILSQWDEKFKKSYTNAQAEDLKSMNIILIDFKKRLRNLLKVHKHMISRYSSKSGEQVDTPPGGQKVNEDRGSAVVEILGQSKEKLEEIMQDLESLMEKGKHLENFAFSMLSTRANGSMERLAVVTIVFLPLTFIASYFSMGFDEFPDLSRSPSYFWEISIPLSIGFFAIFAWSTLRRGVEVAMKTTYRLQDKAGREWYYAKKDIKMKMWERRELKALERRRKEDGLIT